MQAFGRVFMLLVLVTIWAACSEDSRGAGEDSRKEVDDDTGEDVDDPTDTDTDTGEPQVVDENCEEQDMALELSGVKVMFLVDNSGSMLQGNKWKTAREAIDKMVSDPTNKDTRFGLHVFPAPGNCGIFQAGNCGVSSNPVIGMGVGKGAEIVEWMTKNTPCQMNGTPLVAGIRAYLGVRDTGLHSDDSSNYLIVISDGSDSCFANENTGPPFPFNSKNMLAGLADDLKDVSDIKTIPIGFGNIETNARIQLNSLARNGGTSFNEFIPAKDGPALEAALDEIAASIRPCEYRIKSTKAQSDPSKINFYFDGQAVPRDYKHQKGWDWTRNKEMEVEFFGDDCKRIQSGEIEKVSATFGCRSVTDDGSNCADYDALLQFPPAAVMFLLDSSGSMFALGSGTFGGGKWALATTGMTNMMIDDRNNHVKFGLDPFPVPSNEGRGQGNNLCVPSVSPVVPVGAQENRTAIVEWITTHCPDGGGLMDDLGIPLPGSIMPPETTPLLANLERLLNRPGGIDDKGVSGVVVIISDGDDTCSEGDNGAAQLESVTNALVRKLGVRVYVIGYQKGNAENLNAIAAAGNTGKTEHSLVADDAELDQILQEISSVVSSCTFHVPYAGDGVDYGAVNFLFDGKKVPMDVSRTEGWAWQNELTKSDVEFFGKWCDKLRGGEVTDVVIEFGCMVVM